MPDIDPAALSRPHPSVSTGISPMMTTKSAPSNSSSNAPVTASQAPKSSKSSTMAPRLELEAAYMGLKSVIGDGWDSYIEATRLWFSGNMTLPEYQFRLQPIMADPLSSSRHNTLLATIMGNIPRDLPEPGVAPWVTASDKPSTAVSKPASGDAAEQRLKTEIMGLPARDRRRIKEAGREATAAAILGQSAPAANQGSSQSLEDAASQIDSQYITRLRHERLAKDIKVLDSGPQSAGGLSKTNWAVSILPLHTAPTTLETYDLPSLSTLNNRLQPLCYAHALPHGASAQVAPLLLTALNNHIKNQLTSLLTKTRSNGPPMTGLNTASAAVAAQAVGGTKSFITTASFRARLDYEERSWLSNKRSEGGIERNASGRLPVERKAVQNWARLDRNDLALWRELGEGRTWGADEPGWAEAREEEADRHRGKVVGEIMDVEGEGVRDVVMTGMDDDPDDDCAGWEGAGRLDREELANIMSECLALGS